MLTLWLSIKKKSYMKLLITFCIKLKVLTHKVLYISTFNYFFPHFLLFFSFLFPTNWLTTSLLAFYFFQNLIHVTTMLNIKNVFVYSLQKHNTVTLTQVSLLKILCFLPPAVKQWNIILAFSLIKEVSILIEPLLITSRTVLLFLLGVFSFKLLQTNHSTRVTSSKI